MIYKSSADSMNQIYAAASFWDTTMPSSTRSRLNKSASSLIGAGVGGIAGGIAGASTADVLDPKHKKNMLKRALIGAAGGAALGGLGGHLLAGRGGEAAASSGSKTMKELLEEKLKDPGLSAANKKRIEDLLKNLTTKTASGQGAAIGASAMGIYGGVKGYTDHIVGPGQKMSKARYRALKEQEELKSRGRAGLKVKVLEKKLSEIKLREALEGEKSPMKAAYRYATIGAVTGAAAGHFATR